MSSVSSQPQVLTDEPKWSSASLCIALNHLGRTFRPEYTHQLVGDECWRGYRPLESVLREANDEYKSTVKCDQDRSAISASYRSVLHKSHHNHNVASSEIEIKVIISPSCQKCCVDIKRSESDNGEHYSGSEGEPDAKRSRTDFGPDMQQQTGSSQNSPTRGQEVEETMSSSESISKLPIKDSEIMGALCKALPPIISHDDNTSQVEDCFLSEPIGDVLEEFSIPVKKKVASDKGPSSSYFVITVADGKLANVSEYHRCVQKLSLFYIENSDSVDVADDSDGGFWKILYIFQKHEGDADENGKKQLQYSLVGYFTLFHFISLFRKPDPGVIIRVCQALILPPFQGQGHGRRLLQNVYKLAHNSSGQKCASDGDTNYDIVQVNVEDPAPAFVALRNKLDFEFVLEHYVEWNWPNKGSVWCSETSNFLASIENLSLFFTAMTEKEASEMSAKAKITPKQIHVANELFKLKEMQAIAVQHQNKISNADKDAIERMFRLMVKRRLNKEHRDELLEEPSKESQKASLAKLFDKELIGYERILSKIR